MRMPHGLRAAFLDLQKAFQPPSVREVDFAARRKTEGVNCFATCWWQLPQSSLCSDSSLGEGALFRR